MGRKVGRKSSRSPDIRRRISGLLKMDRKRRETLLHQQVIEATHPFGRTRLEVDEIGAVTTPYGLGVDAVQAHDEARSLEAPPLDRPRAKYR